MAVFWLGVYIFVNLTSILWLGAHGRSHGDRHRPQTAARLHSACSPAPTALYGGLKAVALTDIVQVSLLVHAAG